MYKTLKKLEGKKAVCKKSKQKTRGIGSSMRSASEYKNEVRIKA